MIEFPKFPSFFYRENGLIFLSLVIIILPRGKSGDVNVVAPKKREINCEW